MYKPCATADRPVSRWAAGRRGGRENRLVPGRPRNKKASRRRPMKKSTLRRIAHLQRYINKNDGFSDLAAAVQDCRPGAAIPPATVCLSLFWMFQLRLGSLNQLEKELVGDLRKLVPSDRTPLASVDTIGYRRKRFDVLGL